MPTSILLQAAETCDIFVVYKDKVTIKAGRSSFDEGMLEVLSLNRIHIYLVVLHFEVVKRNGLNEVV